MNCTPAEVVAAYIVSVGLGVSTTADWRTTFGFMPADLPDKRITTYDVGGELQGKLHETGERVIKPSVQIRVRGTVGDFRGPTVKLGAILEALSAVNHAALTVNGEPVTLISATVTQDAAYIGQEEKNVRQLFTAVVKVAIR